ncbi:hypothetical protein Halru_0302 [Halovivax ruber XH-70]|uniref:Uncharacterized protein n=1 Tax=Halovivax ruber (strain DSM 18193 / JCM 13892 / XH-70) TaxID=797302 RepID=L0I9N2_HALRX|nr:hypothetical protein [Halovivax ruber]AGB14946.1 hypothetical protein Halru_0302 [Halovivax ruber XH-70]
MRVSVPGIPGVYYDTDAKTTMFTTALTAASRRTPKPNAYALQALALLWSIDVDLREVPNDHPLQYLHPEGAYSLEEFSRDRLPGPDVGGGVERGFQLAYAVNRQAERGIDSVLGRDDATTEGTVIEITEGTEPERPDGSRTDGIGSTDA